MLNNRYRLVLTQPFREKIHGKDKESSNDIEQHYICHYIFNNLKQMERVTYRFNKKYNVNGLQIAEIVYLEKGGECVAILKTFWLKLFLKIFIRKTRNIIHKEKRMRNIRFILDREMKM
jgi:hypothetical protein